YLSSRPEGTYALAAYRESTRLANCGQQGWLMDLAIVARVVNLGVQLEDLCGLTADGIHGLQSRLRICVSASLTEALERSKKTYLLRDRREPQRNSPSRRESMCLRHYLRVKTVAHRRALTRIIFGCRLLAVE
ncbi:hypothetical protein EXIGLDRAFT_596716, partial [Exidia glandulosa HHB12029]